MNYYIYEAGDNGGSLFEINKAIVAAETEIGARKLMVDLAYKILNSHYNKLKKEFVDKAANLWLTEGSCKILQEENEDVVVVDWNQP